MEQPDSRVSPYHYSFVADERTASAGARSGIASKVDRRRLWVIPLLALIVCLGLLLIVARDGPRTMLDWVGVFVFGALILLLVLLGCAWYLAYHLTLKNLRESLFPGALFQSRFEQDSFVVAGPNVVTEYQYDSIHGVTEHDGFVIFFVRGSRVARVLPGDLFPESALRRLGA